MAGAFVLSIRDFKGQPCFVRLPLDNTVGSNFVTQTTTVYNALLAAISGVTMGSVNAARLENAYPGAYAQGDRPTDPDARRECKGLVRYFDATSKRRYTIEIPTVDPGKMHQNGDGLYYVEDSPANNADWDTVGDLLQVSPFLAPDGGVLTIIDIVDVGRRL